MLDLVKNPKDRFSYDAAHIEYTNFVVEMIRCLAKRRIYFTNSFYKFDNA